MTEPGPPGPGSLWQLRDVRILVPARAISMLGDSVLAIVLLLYLQQARIGVWPVAIMLSVESLPIVALAGLAGHVADTRDSRAVLVAATAAQVLACTALAFTHALGGVFALALVVQTGQAFTGPTWTALMPRVVGDDRIGRFASLQSGIAAVAVPAGAGLGGLLYGLAGERAAVLADAGTFAVLLCAAALVQTRRAAAEPAPAQASGAAPGPRGRRRIRMLAGYAVLRRDGVLWPMTWALVATIIVIGGINVVDVFLVRSVLHVSASLFGLSEIAGAVGGIVGSVLAARPAAVTGQVRVTFAGFVVVGLGCLGAGLSPDFPVYLCFAAVIGLANAALNATFAAVMIRRTPDQDRGKAAAAVNGLAQLGMILALVLGGSAGQVLGPRTTFVTCGAAAAAVAVCAAALVLPRIGASRREQLRSTG